MSQKLLAVVLSTLLVACSATRHTLPTSAEELSRLVLVIEEAPGGRVNHHWQRVEDFDFERYKHRSSAARAAGSIVLVSNQQADCYAQYLECYQQCRQTPVPSDFNQYLEDFGPRAGHDRYCSEKCMPQYTKCLQARGQRPQEFTNTGTAVAWLKNNHQSVLVGSLIIVAGVVFVTVSAGAGAIILAPLLVVTAADAPFSTHIAVVSP